MDRLAEGDIFMGEQSGISTSSWRTHLPTWWTGGQVPSTIVSGVTSEGRTPHARVQVNGRAAETGLFSSVLQNWRRRED